MSFVVPFLVIVFLNWSVYKTAKSQIDALDVQVGSLAGSENQQRETSRRRSERKAAVDVSIIIAAFLLCFLPGWLMGIWRHFVTSIEFPVEVVQITSCIFFGSTMCNPIIYTIRKRDFRTAVKKMLRRIGLCANSIDIDNNITGVNNVRCSANLGTQACFAKPTATLTTQHQDGRLSPIPKIKRMEEVDHKDIENNAIVMNNVRLSAILDTEASTSKSAAEVATKDQVGRFYRFSEIQRIDQVGPTVIENNVAGMNNSRISGHGTQSSSPKPTAALATQHQEGPLPPIPVIQQFDEVSANDIDNNLTVENNFMFRDQGT